MAADKETKQTSPETEEEAKAEAPKKEPKAKKEEKNARKEKKAEEKAAETPKAPEPDFKEELRGANDRYLRLLAEYDNFRKRSQREKDSLYGDIKADTVTKFLPVYDNLVRALAQTTEDEAYRKGIEMIMNQFCTTMEKLGVEKIESLGKTFDPALHNAVMHVDDESLGENIVAEEFQKGYTYRDTVVRHSMVKVAN